MLIKWTLLRAKAVSKQVVIIDEACLKLRTLLAIIQISVPVKVRNHDQDQQTCSSVPDN